MGDEKMQNLSQQEMAAIIRRDAPGYRLANKNTETNTLPDSADNIPAESPAEACSPDLNSLYHKYFGVGQAEVDAYADDLNQETAHVEKNLSENKEQIVTVEPENARDSWDRGARAKAVVISNEKRQVIGFQG